MSRRDANYVQQYYDSDLFGNTGQDLGPTRVAEVPIPMQDIRLVIPYELTQQGQTGYRDVIVDKIFMERHSTGIDPYTGTDYGDAKIPEEHQNDPQTGLPIFHRYIAGTQHRIEWPWEPQKIVPKKRLIKQGGSRRKPLWNSVVGSNTWLSKTMGTLRHPITSLRRWRSQGKKVKTVYRKEKTDTTIKLAKRPRSEQREIPSAYDMTDTTRNIVEAENSMAYSLLAPPMPNTLSEELRDEIRELAVKAKKESKKQRSRVKVTTTSESDIRANEAANQRKRAVERMKTPMQLRWELEHAKKLQQQTKSPLVDMQSLLAALGQHMLKNKVKIPKSKIASRVEEVD